MPSPAPDALARRGRRASALVLSTLVVPVLAGCMGAPAGAPVPASRSAEPRATRTVTTTPEAQPSATEPTLSTPTGGRPVPPDVVEEVRTLLEDRSAALLDGSASDVLAGVATGDADLQRQQVAYAAALADLPLVEVDHVLDRATMVRTGSSYDAVVDVHLRIGGFDVRPALTRTVMRFVREGDRLVLGAVAVDGVGGAQPWDLGPVEVRARPDVVGVFDARTVAAVPDLLPAVHRAVEDVAGRVPVTWPASTVVYALSDPRFVLTLDDVPGGDATALDALAFTVPAVGGGVAATRIVLDPELVDRAGPAARDRLLRHEVAHVAAGPLGRGVPLWLAEGTAEWVSVQAMPARDRRISRAALRAARDGLDALPADADFDGTRNGAAYDVSWWACEHLARTRGPMTPWRLAEAYRDADPRDRPDVLREVTGLSEERLARETARLIRRTYGRTTDASPFDAGPSDAAGEGTGPGPATTGAPSPSASS
jgi:hypothetical protein